ncbi:hypothetical protein [Paraburkholderia bannensis]|uniref:hypothetical protein n=1 Tax=Paraburkholderia bannensis TaxID=765414 RepID=UPI002AB5E210|nr:hypothetical protein [Paraburkholderia bannensis]
MAQHGDIQQVEHAGREVFRLDRPREQLRHDDRGDHAQRQYQRRLGSQTQKAELIEKNQIEADKKMREIKWARRQNGLHQQAQTHKRQAAQQDPVRHLVPMKGEPEGQHDADGRAQRTGPSERENLWKIWPESWAALRKPDFPEPKAHPDQCPEHERRTAEVGKLSTIVLRKLLFDFWVFETRRPAENVDQPCAYRAGRRRAF